MLEANSVFSLVNCLSEYGVCLFISAIFVMGCVTYIYSFKPAVHEFSTTKVSRRKSKKEKRGEAKGKFVIESIESNIEDNVILPKTNVSTIEDNAISVSQYDDVGDAEKWIPVKNKKSVKSVGKTSVPVNKINTAQSDNKNEFSSETNEICPLPVFGSMSAHQKLQESTNVVNHVETESVSKDNREMEAKPSIQTMKKKKSQKKIKQIPVDVQNKSVETAVEAKSIDSLKSCVTASEPSSLKKEGKNKKRNKKPKLAVLISLNEIESTAVTKTDESKIVSSSVFERDNSLKVVEFEQSSTLPLSDKASGVDADGSVGKSAPIKKEISALERKDSSSMNSSDDFEIIDFNKTSSDDNTKLFLKSCTSGASRKKTKKSQKLISKQLIEAAAFSYEETSSQVPSDPFSDFKVNIKKKRPRKDN